MSDIPEDRLCVDENPFTNTGVDYIGPDDMKLSKWTQSNQVTAKRLPALRLPALFICLTMGAVHLQMLVISLQIDAFLLPLRKFISRRSKVKIMPNNGTNFVGT